jgi:uncharacterized protein (TIGR03435 family)
MKSIATCLILVSTAGLCQSAAPAFEVASIRPHTLPPGTFAFSSGPANVQISGNRVTVRGSTNIRGLVMYAYNVNEHQLSGTTKGGVWDEFYEIAATAPGEGEVSVDQVRLMFQALLADRFRLKLHRETAELLVYNLRLGKNGSKLKVSGPETKPGIVNKSAVDESTRELLVRFELSHEPVSELVRVLSLAITDGPVLDKTGFTGAYDFTLEFVRDPFGASAKAAVQEQLGLRIEAAKEPAEILMIESVRKPSEN